MHWSPSWLTPAWSRCSDIGRHLGHWRRLTARERLSLVGCVPMLAIIHASLAIAGYRRTRQWVEGITRHPSPRASGPTDIAYAQSLAKLTAIAGRHGVVEATCLRQSLFLYGWLRRRGLRPALNLGIRQDIASLQGGQPFQAHAWVELDGTALLPSDANHVAFEDPRVHQKGAGQAGEDQAGTDKHPT